MTPTDQWPINQRPTNPDASPVLDGWGWGDYWSASQWLEWHAAVKARYGLDTANRRFIAAWSEQGFGAEPLNARTFDSSFRAYAKSNGFFDGLFYGIGALAKPLGVVASDIPDAVSDIGQGVKTTGKLATWLVPVLLVSVAVLYFLPSLLRGYKAAKAAK